MEKIMTEEMLNWIRGLIRDNKVHEFYTSPVWRRLQAQMHVGVAADVLGGGVDHHIGAIGQRVLKGGYWRCSAATLSVGGGTLLFRRPTAAKA